MQQTLDNYRARRTVQRSKALTRQTKRPRYLSLIAAFIAALVGIGQGLLLAILLQSVWLLLVALVIVSGFAIIVLQS